jgi:hypothetical protein
MMTLEVAIPRLFRFPVGGRGFIPNYTKSEDGLKMDYEDGEDGVGPN